MLLAAISSVALPSTGSFDVNVPSCNAALVGFHERLVPYKDPNNVEMYLANPDFNDAQTKVLRVWNN